MKRTVGIIGTGRVGASVAISVLLSGAVDELLLCDAHAEIAEGEAMDLAHGASFYPAATVRTATLNEMGSADIIVVTAGRGGRPDESRLELLRDNASIIRNIGLQLVGYRGVIVVVSNPVDVLTQIMTEASGLPPSRVLGTGTMLDTARLRQKLGQLLRLDPHSIHAQVVGEHGDSEVILWSSAHVGGLLLKHLPGWDNQWVGIVADEVRNAAYRIIQKKGSTNHAVGLVIADLLKCMLRGERRVLTVSRIQEDGPGLQGIALSMPAIVSGEGAVQVLVPEMDDAEQRQLAHSAELLRQARIDAY